MGRDDLSVIPWQRFIAKLRVGYALCSRFDFYEYRCNRPEYTPAELYPGLKRPRLAYTRVYYGLGQLIPRSILWPRPIHTPSGQIIHPWYQSQYQ